MNRESSQKSSRQRFAAFRQTLREEGVDAVRQSMRKRHEKKSDADKSDEQKKAERKARQREYIRQYRDWLWPYRFRFALVFGLAVVAALIDMLSPAATGLLVDKVLLVEDMTRSQKIWWINGVGIGLLSVLLLSRFIETWRAYVMAVLGNTVIFRLRRRLHYHMLRLPLDTLSDFKTGGIVSRLSGDVDQVTGLVQLALISPGVAIIRIVVAISILYIWNWQLALAATAILPPAVWVSVMYIRRIRPIYRAAREDRSQTDARATETFSGLRVVRAFRREPREQHDYAVGHHTMIRKRMYARVMEMGIDVVWELLIPIIVLAIVWLGSLLYLFNRAEIGQIMAFQMYAGMLMWPIFRIVFSMSQLQRALAAMDRVFEVLSMEPDKPNASDAVDAPPVADEIRFEHVNFEYDEGVPVIRDFDLTVPGGAVVALVGPSGAGKTTMTDLVARFYDPTTGRILVNGIDLRQVKLEGYRQLLAIVQQEVFLFDGTVRENISYGRRNAPEEDVVHAAVRANADSFIRDLPDGYDTLIGERGVKLSGGQRQRLSIARAILADPQILILDEATSNLDSESEALIQDALAELYANRTTFVIAHRLSTVTHADIIVVLDGGEIVEVGRHEELMRQDGTYAAMVAMQAERFGQAVQTVD